MQRPRTGTSRRQFLQRTLSGAGALGLAHTSRAASVLRWGGADKLRVGVIGVANRGRANLDGVAGEEVVALCDVDAGYLKGAAERFPAAKTFADFRELIAMDGLDAVVVSTPDHTHAAAAIPALERGLPVYCEKPLAHTVAEARRMAELATEKGVATQMGTQIHAGANYRRVVEAIQTGTIGEVHRVHVFCNKTWSGGELPTERPPVPEGLNWDLWLGPSQERPYHPTYHPAGWRRWWAFGGGTLADMACHYMDLPHWALHLTYPTAIEATGPEVHPETTPKEIVVRYEHPRRGALRPVDLFWYDGTARPAVLEKLGLQSWGNGVLFEGEEGWLIADYGRFELGPKSRHAETRLPDPYIPNSIGHHAEWIRACKEGTRTTCPFQYSGALSEAVMLGNVAFRAGTRVEWDAANLRVTNSEAAQKLISKDYRAGWKLV